jgi:hypothetical protein
MSKENYNDVLDINFTDDQTITYKDNAMYLYGFKVNCMEQMYSPCNIMLGAWDHYGVAMHEGQMIESAMSITIKFLTDEKTLRFGVRLNGASFGSVITLEDATVCAPFVIPNACGGVESSSSSSSSSSNSSSSQSSQSSSSSLSSSSSKSSASSSSSSSSSSTSSSSEGLTSASSKSTESSQSSSSSSTSSESAHGACAEYYCGAGFSISELRGNYRMSGTYNSKPAYKNDSGVIWMWYDTATGYWAMSNNKGDPMNQWASTTDTAVACPNGDVWVDDDGTVTVGFC